ncbi:hypothetical protein [Streptomyces sp. NPDC048650]|uniref:hypothetical protein n=1 Tax=Streptomyces sp. NPDC048650 TaxID=3365583 RepID=UPI00371289EF
MPVHPAERAHALLALLALLALMDRQVRGPEPRPARRAQSAAGARQGARSVGFSLTDQTEQTSAAGRQGVPSAHQLHPFRTLAEELHLRCSAQRVALSQAAFSPIGALTLADPAVRPHIGRSLEIPRVRRDFWSADPRPDGSPVRCTSHRVTDDESALPVVAPGEGIRVRFPPQAAGPHSPRPGVRYAEVTDPRPWTAALAGSPRTATGLSSRPCGGSTSART